MTVLPLGVLFLSAFVNNILFIQVDPNIRESFICMSINNSRNDTWPSTWKRMNVNNGLYSYKLDSDIINKSSIVEYKLRLYFVDRRYLESKDWNELYRKSEECNINVCLTFLIIFVISFICMLGYVIFNAYYK